MTSRNQRLQNWTGGTWNIIKLIGMNPRMNPQKGTGTKIAEKFNSYEKFERKKKSNFSTVLNPETS